RVTHEQPPLLPWVHEAGAPGIGERLARFLQTTAERVVGHVAAFYLPYADEAIGLYPGIRIVCLKRPREEIVAAFWRFFDTRSARVS
ncbi:MAG: hypothetical protein NUV77_26890, partial [Thermoguttaceae bacterium]|nr:hypothetical protein [Thermoguttaceae bacterium]